MTRISTRLPDLDLVLGGGLVPGSVIVVAGEPGTGKTILAQQICFLTATTELGAVYYTTLSEPHAKLVEHLGQFTFFDRPALGTRVEYIHLGGFLPHSDTEGRGLDSFVSEVVRRTFEAKPAVVVIDSIRMLRDLFSESELRAALYDLAGRVSQTGAILLLLGEYSPQEMHSGPEFAIADGILHLAYEPREPLDRRWLRVIKMRGGSHREGKHTFLITEQGLEVFPRIETLLPAAMPALSGRISSGTTGLDELMGDGIRAGDATLVMGPSGAGKTIFSLRYISEGLAQGETCVYITFQDTADQLIGMAAGFGWDLNAARDAGQLAIEHVPMGTLDLDVLVSVIRRLLSAGQTTRVVLDSLAEMVFAARESERFPAYLRSLNALIRSFGASLLVTSETTTLGPIREPLDGLEIGERLEGVSGVLGWSVLSET